MIMSAPVDSLRMHAFIKNAHLVFLKVFEIKKKDFLSFMLLEHN